MAVRVKYNHTMKFRRRAAFYRMYRSRNPRRQFLFEMVAAGVCLSVAAVVRFGFADSTAHALIYVFFFAAVFAVYFLVRLLRAAVMVLRIRKVAQEDVGKEYLFDERGFAFGPVNREGAMVETRWRDIDKVYFMGGAIYILLMGRRHWAAVDPSLMIEGAAGEPEALIRASLPKRLIVG